MRDHQGCTLDMSGCKSGKRYQGACAGFDINLLEVGRRISELRRNFHDNPVLVELSEDHRNLPLSESVIEGVVDGLDRDVQPRGLGAVDLNMKLETTFLLVARHIRKLRQSPQLLNQL